MISTRSSEEDRHRELNTKPVLSSFVEIKEVNESKVIVIVTAS